MKGYTNTGAVWQLRHKGEKVDEWEAAYDEIRKDLTLLYPDGNPVPEYLLHVKDGNAWWRWNDQPFRG